MSERNWADDRAQKTVGSRGQVRRVLIEGIADAEEGCRQVSLSIAAKSVVTCPSHAGAKSA
eukprot:4408348-Pyramimonas_sp.AAC.1